MCKTTKCKVAVAAAAATLLFIAVRNLKNKGKGCKNGCCKNHPSNA